MSDTLLDEDGNPMTLDKALDLYEEGYDSIPSGTMAFIRAQVERLRAIETRLSAAIAGADCYTEFGTADLRHFLGEG
jgi:hypothetical protein